MATCPGRLAVWFLELSELFGAEDVSPPKFLEAHCKDHQLRVVMVGCFDIRVAPGGSG
jgi:hypothetical protein